MDIEAFSQVSETFKLENGKLPKFEQTLFYKHARGCRIVHDESVQVGDFIAKAAPGFNGWDIFTYFVLEVDFDSDEVIVKKTIKQACPVIVDYNDEDHYLEDDLVFEIAPYVYELSQFPHKIYFHESGFEEEDSLEHRIPFDTIIVDAGYIVKAGEASVKTDLRLGNKIDSICFCNIKEGMILATEDNGTITYKIVQALHRYASLFILCELPEAEVDAKFIPLIKKAMQEQKQYLQKTLALQEFIS